MTYRIFCEICKQYGGAWRPANIFAFADCRIGLGPNGAFITRYDARKPQTKLAATPENLVALIGRNLSLAILPE